MEMMRKKNSQQIIRFLKKQGYQSEQVVVFKKKITSKFMKWICLLLFKNFHRWFRCDGNMMWVADQIEFDWMNRWNNRRDNEYKKNGWKIYGSQFKKGHTHTHMRCPRSACIKYTNWNIIYQFCFCSYNLYFDLSK